MATITLGCGEAADRNSPGVDKLRRLLEHECEGQVSQGLCTDRHRQEGRDCVHVTWETGVQGVCASCRELAQAGAQVRVASRATLSPFLLLVHSCASTSLVGAQKQPQCSALASAVLHTVEGLDIMLWRHQGVGDAQGQTVACKHETHAAAAEHRPSCRTCAQTICPISPP